VDALIDQLAAARQRRVGAPFLVVADPAAVAVAAAHEHQRPERAARHQVVRLLQRRVVAMVEADPHAQVVGAGERHERLDLGHRASRGLLDQHVLAGLEGRARDLGQRVVGGGDDDDVHVGAGDGVLPAGFDDGGRRD
jgi:hypothetical protein